MRPRSIFIAAFFLAVLPYTTLAQPTRKDADVEPPRLENVAAANTTSQLKEALADVLAIKPEIPLGPLDVLNEYEQGIALIAQNLSAEIANILQAQQANQISREQAEYLIQERYQTATMQYEVLTGLRDALEFDVAKAAASARRLGRTRESDTAVVVELPSSEPSEGCK